MFICIYAILLYSGHMELPAGRYIVWEEIPTLPYLTRSYWTTLTGETDQNSLRSALTACKTMYCNAFKSILLRIRQS